MLERVPFFFGRLSFMFVLSKMKMKSLVILGILSFIALSCDNIFCCDDDRVQNDEFTLWGAFEDQGQLRFDGVYIQLDEDSLVERSMVLYEDGIAYGVFFGGCSGRTLEETINEYCLLESDRDCTWCWGAFDIQENSILFQEPFPTPTIADYQIRNYHGIVINDTSFVRLAYGRNYYEEPQICQFFQADKPDSNNTLIDQLGAPEDQ